MPASDAEYRRKVLQPRPGLNRDEWTPIPSLQWGSRDPAIELDDVARMFMRGLMAAVDETVGATRAVQFVVLMKVDSRPGELELVVISPFRAPLDLLRRGDARRHLPRVADLDIELRFGLRSDVRVPVVVDCDRRNGRYAFNNANQLQAPRQFINPYWTTTTSGFLNFIGAFEIDGAEMMVVSHLEALHDQGLDEWFRWLYCTTETGVVFDSRRLLVRRDDPETWIYDYDGE